MISQFVSRSERQSIITFLKGLGVKMVRLSKKQWYKVCRLRIVRMLSEMSHWQMGECYKILVKNFPNLIDWDLSKDTVEEALKALQKPPKRR